MTDLGLLMLMLFAVAAGVDVVVATVLVFVSLTEGVGTVSYTHLTLPTILLV